MEFAPGKGYIVSATASAVKRTELGTLVEGTSGKPTGISGVNLILQAASTLRGQIALYGGTIKQKSGGLSLAPGTAGLSAEIVNYIIESVNTVTLGAAGVNSLRRIYNVDLGFSGLSGRASNLVADTIERMVLGGSGMGNLINTAAAFSAKEITFAGTPSLGDLHYTGTFEANLLEPTWSGNAPQCDLSIAYVNEWWRFQPYAFDMVSGSPVSGVSLQLYDKFGSLLMDEVTDILGLTSFGADVFVDMVKARRLLTVAGVVVDEPLGPFTLVVNRGATVNADYLGYQYLFNWPYTDLPSGYGRQLRPIGDGIPLVPRYGGGGREEWRGGFA